LHGADLIEVNCAAWAILVDGVEVGHSDKWLRVCPECEGGKQILAAYGKRLGPVSAQ
jgi:hypothetical protein